MGEEFKNPFNAKVIVGAIVIVIAIIAVFVVINNNNQQSWEDLAEDTLDSKGYRVERMVTCDATRLGDEAMVSGTFYNTSHVLKNFVISYVKDGSTWVVNNYYVY